jgi:toxin YoeB
MTFQLVFSGDAGDDLAFFKKHDGAAYGKAEKLLPELMEHPYTGTGKPKPLKFDLSGKWSRRINREHRIIYTVDVERQLVEIYSLRGHYISK